MPADLGALKSELPKIRSTKALAECEYARAREEEGDLEGAVACYKGALQLNPLLRVARRRLSVVLVKIGRKDEAVVYIRTELRDKCGEEWFTNLITKAMESPDLALAGDLAGLL